MATGIIGVVSGVATLNYTPTTNAKVITVIGGSAAASVSINGVSGLATNAVTSTVTTYVGAGQTLTVVTVATSTAVVSSIEES